MGGSRQTRLFINVDVAISSHSLLCSSRALCPRGGSLGPRAGQPACERHTLPRTVVVAVGTDFGPPHKLSQAPHATSGYMHGNCLRSLRMQTAGPPSRDAGAAGPGWGRGPVCFPGAPGNAGAGPFKDFGVVSTMEGAHAHHGTRPWLVQSPDSPQAPSAWLSGLFISRSH